MPELELLEGVAALPRDAWDALVGDGSPFLEWGWLASLEESGAVRPENGWAPRPLVVREDGRVAAACPLYAKAHSEGEFVFDHGFADAAERAGISYYPKLLAGVPFTPVTGARLLTAPGADRPRLLRVLAGALRELCLAHEISGAHVNFCLDDERAALEEAGFLPRLGLQYHWTNPGFRDFADYLDSLRSKRRNQVRRERRELDAQGVRIELRAGAEIPDAWLPRLFDVYLVTVRHHPWGRQYLNARFFELLAERFRERLCFAAALRGEELVAGAVNVEKDALYGRYWGALRPLRHLHFNVCYYAGIERCIAARLPRFEPGAGGQYKQLRGFDAAPTWSCHFFADARLHDAVRRFLEGERAEAHRTLEWYAEHSAHRRDAGEERLEALRQRLSRPPGATPGART